MLTIPQLSCIDNFKVSMIKYFKFEGRARRSEFWYFKLTTYIINFIYITIAKIILAIANDKTDPNEIEKIDISDSTPLLVIAIIIGVIFIIPSISVSVRRLHDVGRQGETIFMGLIPLGGGIALLYLLCSDSMKESNEYGPSTKYASSELKDEINEKDISQTINCIK